MVAASWIGGGGWASRRFWWRSGDARHGQIWSVEAELRVRLVCTASTRAGRVYATSESFADGCWRRASWDPNHEDFSVAEAEGIRREIKHSARDLDVAARNKARKVVEEEWTASGNWMSRSSI
ncbi:hypothetical protein M0R45_024584 [Rubus argutus]|uniref:MHC class I antigen n=1 Tax=Rubus argutus TaxID=59490 RepID=A0AAW1WTN7_RUBAR